MIVTFLKIYSDNSVINLLKEPNAFQICLFSVCYNSEQDIIGWKRDTTSDYLYIM